MPEHIDSIVARLKSKDYGDDTNALSKDIADGMAAVARQPDIDRGLKNNTIADVQGGTSLGVGDPAAGNISAYLTQNPQPGIPRNVGSGLRTRRQTRIETRTRVLPGKVLESAGAGDSTVRVSVVGTGTGKTNDSVTGIEVVDNLTAPLADSVDDIQGQVFDAAMTGQPIVTAGSDGIQPIAAGRTVDVAVSEQWEVTTTHTKRWRKSLPVITRVLRSSSAAVTNGLASLGTQCVIAIDEFFGFIETIDPVDGADWDYNTGNTFTVGRPWVVIELGSFYSSGALVLGVDVTAYASGTIPAGGLVPFSGIPYSSIWPTGRFYDPQDKTDPNYLSWGFYVIIGCSNVNGDDYGTIDFSGPQGDPGHQRTWTLRTY